jgi:hypothetical protein
MDFIRYILIILFIFTFVLDCFAQIDQNYIKTYSPKTQTSSESVVISGDKEIVVVSTNFYDGLGRIKQAVIKKGSPKGNDIITFHLYDDAGRESKKYLPYVSQDNDGLYKKDAFNSQNLFYTDAMNVVKTTHPYSVSIFEDSPLDRVIEQGNAGVEWQPGHNSLKFVYRDNYIEEDIINWQNSNNQITFLDYYQPNQLVVIQSEDENNNSIIEYKNREGEVILKRVLINPDEQDYVEKTREFEDFKYSFDKSELSTAPASSFPYFSSAISIQENVNINFHIAFEHYQLSQAAPLITGDIKDLSDYLSSDIEYLDLGEIQANYDNNPIFGYRAFIDQNILKIVCDVSPAPKISQINFKSVRQYNYLSDELIYDPSHWAETYYVYDDYGNLRTVLPPKLVNDISSRIEAGFVIPATELEGLAFQYEYDGRKRMTRKKVPGAEWVEMIYDDRDRLALTQDGEQSKEGKWMFTKYDALNRPVMTGKVSYNDRTAAEQALTTFYSGVENTGSKYYESRSSTGTEGYDNTSFPELSGDFKVHTVTYYDDYDVLNESHFNSVAPSADDFDYETGITEYTDNDADLWTSMKGQVTATKTLLYDIGAGDQYIHTVTYYDWKYRPIQIRSTNQFGGLNVVHNLYDFVGNLTHSREVYSVDASGSEQYVINKEYIYDHADRLLEVYHQIGDDANNRVLVLQNKYNELGELIEKNLHAANVNEPDNTNYLQSLDYRYNIRGWLQSINTPTTRPDATINPDDNSQIDDAFGMELLYTNPTLND